MKRNGIINRGLSYLIANLGHTDEITVCDCGLPISDEKWLIDLSITKGFPRFIDVIKEIEKDVVIEKIVLAKEIIEKNPAVMDEILEVFDGKEIEYIDHIEFKERVNSKSKAVVRTGEATPYSNVILISGVDY